jgi:phosphate starvation-inducible PhoH-like protein
MSAISDPEPQTPMQIAFDDTALLSPLFGEHDRHLARIEQRLGVTLVPRGNKVAIIGETAVANAARGALLDLYERLKDGLEVTLADVDGAVRMAEAKPVSDSSGDAGQRRRTHLAETQIRTQKTVITPRSPKQADYVRTLQSEEMVFALGPAGTGKTYLAVAVGVSMLLSGQVERIILTRPVVEAGESLGFLPGALEEKIDPYMRPMYDALYDMIPGDRLARRREAGEIEIAPLAYMRGRTLSKAFVILDEAQNTSAMQMKMFLTRMGEDSRMVITGDPSQIDLPARTPSGLLDAVDTLSAISEIKFIRFGQEDVIRHSLVRRIVGAYDERGKT